MECLSQINELSGNYRDQLANVIGEKLLFLLIRLASSVSGLSVANVVCLDRPLSVLPPPLKLN